MLREFEPDFLLTSLLKLPLAIELKRRTGIPVCFLNPSIYFGDEDGKQFSRNLADRAVSRVEQLL